VEAKDKVKELFPTFDVTIVPRTRTGNGWQLFFKHPSVAVPNGPDVIPGLDVRGDGGYVVAPPSIHPSAKTVQSETETGAFYKIFKWSTVKQKQRAIVSPRREL
jgi:hypothetical protein